MGELERFRREIDEVDSEILRLLNRRAEIAQKIGEIKRQEGINFHSPEREMEIVERLRELNQGPFPDEALRAVYREILSASISLEKPLNIAYFGLAGSFTHLAAMMRFGSSVQYLSQESIKKVFDAVEKGKADYGVVPIENSTEGVVNYTLDMFIDSELKIASEIMTEINHNLLSKTGKKEDIKIIYSHPQPTAQCKNWLEENMPDIEIKEATSTTRAAELASRDPSAAAIASELAASLYDLKYVEKNIGDITDNYTRFLVIAQSFPSRSGKDKTSILFSVKDRPGALYSILQPFAKGGINLTKIESRPSRRKAWEYIFFVDMQGHVQDDAVRNAIEEMKEGCLYLKILGSYPSAE